MLEIIGARNNFFLRMGVFSKESLEVWVSVAL